MMLSHGGPQKNSSTFTTFEAPLIGDSEDDPGLPDHQAHLIPTALPNTGIGDDFQLWRMGALLLLLFLIMIAARTRRQRK